MDKLTSNDAAIIFRNISNSEEETDYIEIRLPKYNSDDDVVPPYMLAIIGVARKLQDKEFCEEMVKFATYEIEKLEDSYEID